MDTSMSIESSSTTTMASQEYDLILMVDATASMGAYLTSIRTSLPQILSLSSLTGCFKRIGLLAYRDYDYLGTRDLVQWSGWLEEGADSQSQPDLIQMAQKLRAKGGADWDEGVKTGLASAYNVMREDAKTLIILFADAPPHTIANSDEKDESDNYCKEQKELQRTEVYGESAPKFMDWVSACSTFKKTKKAQIFTIFAPSSRTIDYCYFMFLSEITDARFIKLKSAKPEDISKATISVLLAWMGIQSTHSASSIEMDIPASIVKYKTTIGIDHVLNERHEKARMYFPMQYNNRNFDPDLLKMDAKYAELMKDTRKRDPVVADFAKRYQTDESYRQIVSRQLKEIINNYVSAMSTNPIFGTLWRAFCNDRSNQNREELLTAFGLAVDRLSNHTEKEAMKEWLENSYDYSAEVVGIINEIPEERRFPCVFLDPTLTFANVAQSGDDSKVAPIDIKSFTRNDLLDIGRSCDARVLRRLGQCLTQMTYVSCKEDMPKHIDATTNSELQKIPLALASKDFGKQFWRILLHLVVPGTMLSARPAAVLAALAIRMQVKPLLDVAEIEMINWRDKWNNLQNPETYSFGCLALLLDADRLYRQAHKDATIGLLLADDRKFFDLLTSYRMLENNMKTTLKASVAWTPNKAARPIGPTVKCRLCNSDRSVTIMSDDYKCGICVDVDPLGPEELEDRKAANVSTTTALWVECCVERCRGQYVVYNPGCLRVRPKCFYCRTDKMRLNDSSQTISTPRIECRKCLNNIIYPTEYRPPHLIQEDFECYACGAGTFDTIVEQETTPEKLSKENSTDWLVKANLQYTNFIPCDGYSVHSMATVIGPENPDRLILFPETQQPLYIKCKLIRNKDDVINQLRDWISRRKAERGTCSLCFNTTNKRALLRACGRHGCAQMVDSECLSSWYGLNRRGQIINVAALSCPFCRRSPTAKTLANWGMGIHAVRDLNKAVAENGEWIYCWCAHCNTAKRYMERVCAAGDAPTATDFVCEDCSSVMNVDRPIKPCPKCGVMTEKTGGCDHLQCPSCGTHWCYFCGAEQTEAGIYKHMSEEHGGYFDGGDGDFNADDVYTDEASDDDTEAQRYRIFD